MYLSNFYLPILKQTGDGLISYKYSVRAGLVRQLTSGIYSWLPLGVRVLEKIQRIIHAEMEKIETFTSNQMDHWTTAIQTGWS